MAIYTGEIAGLEHGRVHIGTGRVLLIEIKKRFIVAIAALQRITLFETFPFALGQFQTMLGKFFGRIDEAGDLAPDFLASLNLSNHLV